MDSIDLLVVDDETDAQNTLVEHFNQLGIKTRWCVSADEAISTIQSQAPGVVLCDIKLLCADGSAVINYIKSKNVPSVVILTTGLASMDGAVQAFKNGAFDYVCKPFRLDELNSMVQKAMKHSQLLRKAVVKVPVPLEKKGQHRHLVGRSPKIIDVYKMIAKAGLSSSHILIQGESGSGKELVARAIHENSRRAERNFVAVNCGALTESLLESELFGYVKGAFTGAQGDRKGLFEEADKGTLFLDEIGDISLGLQVRLLRAIQEGEIRPVGSSRSKKVDVRIISATHCNLEALVTEKKFRQDLYYRLNVIKITVPSLRERLEDLEEIMNHLLIRFSEKLDKKVTKVSSEAMKCLALYPWPGNVRELENTLERAVNMTDNNTIYPADLPEEIIKYKSDSLDKHLIHLRPVSSWKLEDMEKDHILRVLQEFNFSRSKAATALGIDRATLYRKLLRYKLPQGLPDKL